MNQGVDKTGQYVSADQLYDRFYRPDLLHNRLHGDPQKLWQQKGAKSDVKTVLSTGLPPHLALVKPSTDTSVGQPSTEVRVALRDQGGGIGKVVWKVDGVTVAVAPTPDDSSKSQRQSAARRIPPDKTTRTLTQEVILTPGINTVEVTAYNRRNDVASPPLIVTITMQPPAVATPSNRRKTPVGQELSPIPAPLLPPELQPSLHMLVVGVDRYRDQQLLLNYAVSDAGSLASSLQQMAAPLFREVTVEKLFDEDVTIANLST